MMRHLQTRGEVVPRGDNPRYVLQMRCQATGIIFGKAVLSSSGVGEATAQTAQHVQEVAVTHGAGPHVQE